MGKCGLSRVLIFRDKLGTVDRHALATAEAHSLIHNLGRNTGQPGQAEEHRVREDHGLSGQLSGKTQTEERRVKENAG